MMSMLASIMFFGITPEDVDVGDSKGPEMSQEIGMGTIRVTWFDILVGIESGLLVLPGNLLILEIFRNVRSRHPSKGDKSVEIVAESEDDKSETTKTTSELSTKSITTASLKASDGGNVPHHAGDGSQNHPEQKPSEAQSHETITQEKMNNEHDIESQSQSATNECSKSADVSVRSIHVSTTEEIPPCCCLRPCYKGSDHDDVVSGGGDSLHRTASSSVLSSSDSQPESSSLEAPELQNRPPFFMRHEDYLHHHINTMHEEIYHAPEGYFKSEEDRKKVGIVMAHTISKIAYCITISASRYLCSQQRFFEERTEDEAKRCSKF